MSEENAQQEPTMEEILASIRRIISEDAEGGAEEPTLAPEQDAEEPEVLELTDTLEEPVLVVKNPEPADIEEDDWDLDEPEEEAPTLEEAVFDDFEEEFEEEVFVEEAPAVEPVGEPVQSFDAPADPEFDDPDFDPEPEFTTEPEPEPMFKAENELLSESAAGAAAASFDSLSKSLPVSEEDGRTLEGIVTDMLRPILKDWLDQNLPGIVEELVQKEIERVSGRGD